MQLLIDALYSITVFLGPPTIVALLAVFAGTLFEIGGFLREWRARRVSYARWEEFLLAIHRGGPASASALRAEFYDLPGYPTLLAIFAERSKEFQDNRACLNKLLAEIELRANKSFYFVRAGIRIGPMLGLMGTLIPMGPALKAISTGNMEAMSSNLIIAFSTTVVGLVIAGLCYTIFLVRQYWYSKDISDLDYLLEIVFAMEAAR